VTGTEQKTRQAVHLHPDKGRTEPGGTFKTSTQRLSAQFSTAAVNRRSTQFQSLPQTILQHQFCSPSNQHLNLRAPCPLCLSCREMLS
jgi:hypothetical protein